ncbi:MAG: RidA family protein [Bacteroidales bacterium]|nr:RidA family protein [Bacteroidales bacterium]
MSNLGKQIPVRSTYVSTKEERFEAGVLHLLEQYVPVYTPVRLVFFRNIPDNQEYLRQLDFIRKAVTRHFPCTPPVITLVSQTPLSLPKGLLMEISEVRTDKQDLIQYKSFENESYITISHPGGKNLYIGGILCPENTLPVKEQTDFIFHTIEQILSLESMPIHSIVRQWNYIEQITGYDGDYQRYQAFNDGRSLFYQHTGWPRGYPAATGIGTSRGGIVVELQAHLPADASYHDVAVGNWLQVPAYEYSRQVLCGKEDEAIRKKTTPKFERAKIIFRGENSPFIYVSGTAAIREK